MISCLANLSSSQVSKECESLELAKADPDLAAQSK